MSETQTPPDATPETPAPPAQKYLLDNPVLRGVLDLVALASPAPVLLVLVNFWLTCLASDALKTQDANTVFRQIFEGSGQPPMWALPLAFVPGVLLLIVLHRKSGPKMLGALVALVAAGAARNFLPDADDRGMIRLQCAARHVGAASRLAPPPPAAVSAQPRRTPRPAPHAPAF